MAKEESMIRSFRDQRTRSINDGTVRKGFPVDLVRRAQLLLAVIDAARELSDLASPPGNRLEKL
ncbi:MAG TPA: type II toxin-antitoxin system RelE/ParE family toxin, partial [Rhizobiaceae bacterium]|nr:type II toxin-antitoxin system RelE/ParE family toxin [Rhizobiaceae bacterium]